MFVYRGLAVLPFTKYGVTGGVDMSSHVGSAILWRRVWLEKTQPLFQGQTTFYLAADVRHWLQRNCQHMHVSEKTSM